MLLALLAGWGITLRLVLLICVPIAAVVVIVALIVIYLGTVGVAALLTGGGGSYGIKRLLTRRRCRRAATPRGCKVTGVVRSVAAPSLVAQSRLPGARMDPM